MTQGRSYSLSNPTRCQECAFLTYRKANQAVMELVREMAGWDSLPATFDVIGDGWKEAEALIDKAVAANDARATTDACIAYEQRVQRYLEAWRQIKRREAERAEEANGRKAA